MTHELPWANHDGIILPSLTRSAVHLGLVGLRVGSAVGEKGKRLSHYRKIGVYAMGEDDDEEKPKSRKGLKENKEEKKRRKSASNYDHNKNDDDNENDKDNHINHYNSLIDVWSHYDRNIPTKAIQSLCFDTPGEYGIMELSIIDLYEMLKVHCCVCTSRIIKIKASMVR